MFGDRMGLGDTVGLSLECGHPNHQPEETCSICGKIVPGSKAEQETKEEKTHE